MSTLSDILRTATREINDAIRQVDQRVEHLEQEREGFRKRIEQVSVSLRRTDADVEERRRLVEDAAQQLERIEEEMRRLEVQKREKARAHEEASRAAAEVEEKRSNLRRQIKQEEVGRSALERDLAGLDDERSRHGQQLAEKRRRAVAQHAESVWRSICSQATALESTKLARSSAEALARARQENPEVASLCEAREQWQMFLKGPVVPMVRQTAERELAGIEKEIERLYPGGLEAGSTAASTSDFEDFYWYAEGAERIVLLPIPERVHESVAAGGQGVDETLALRLVWAICRSGLVPESGIEFCVRSGLAAIRLEAGFESGADEVVSLDMGSDLTIAALVSRLPSEIEEVLR